MSARSEPSDQAVPADQPLVDPRHLAAHPRPCPHLDRLGRRPVHRLPDGWFVAGRPEDVEALLAHPDVVVGFVSSPGDAVDQLQASMARFSDGDDHRRRRAAVGVARRHLHPGLVRRHTRREVAAAIAPGPIDVMPLARRVPTTVLARALGVPDAEAAVDAVDLLCRRLAPSTTDVDRPDAADVADALVSAFGPVTDGSIATVSLLFQAMDATAALVAGAILDHLRAPTDARHVPPIMLTTRRTTRPIVIGGVDVPADSPIVIHLGAATAASSGDLTFGRGARACPGSDLAAAIAAGFVDALAGHGAVLADGSPDAYEPRPNLRIPTSLVVAVGPVGPTDGRPAGQVDFPFPASAGRRPTAALADRLPSTSSGNDRRGSP